MNEETIKNELRLFALESIVCQHLATFYQSVPREIFDAIKKQAMGGAQRPVFAGSDPTLSDHLSAEFQTALERLYGMIQHHLDTAQSRENPKKREPK